MKNIRLIKTIEFSANVIKIKILCVFYHQDHHQIKNLQIFGFESVKREEGPHPFTPRRPLEMMYVNYEADCSL